MLTKAGLSNQVRRIGPVWMAFVGSLVLSWIAAQGRLVNKDGIIYLDIARHLEKNGPSGLTEILGFNFYPLLVAYLSGALPFELETTARLLDTLMMAGTCAIVVRWVRWKAPETAWAACLIVLSIPAFNQYRSDILREYGFWFFSLAGLYLAAHWHESGRWRTALAGQALLLAAALFRFEAVAFLLALLVWQFFAAPANERLRKLLQIGLLPLAATAALAAAILSGAIELPWRIEYYSQAIDPLRKADAFAAAAQHFQESVLLFKYSREEAGYMLLFGLLSVIPVKFIALSGIFFPALIGAFWRRSFVETLSRWQPLPWMFLIYLVVLVAFVTHNFFMLGRYVSLLHWLLVPFFALGLHRFWAWRPRWQVSTIVLALFVCGANVISLGPRKDHVIEAARWLAIEVQDPAQVCLNDARIAYYAGWPLSRPRITKYTSALLSESGCRVLVVETESKRLDQLASELLSRGYVEKVRFTDKTTDAVIVAVPAR